MKTLLCLLSDFSKSMTGRRGGRGKDGDTGGREREETTCNSMTWSRGAEEAPSTMAYPVHGP